MNDQKPFIALTPALSSAVKKFMNKLGIMPVFKSEYCSYFIGNSCRFLVNKCSYLHDFFFGLWSFDQMSVIAVKPCWSQMKIFFMFSRLFTFDILLQKKRLINKQQFLSTQIRELNFCCDRFPPHCQCFCQRNFNVNNLPSDKITWRDARNTKRHIKVDIISVSLSWSGK